MEHYDFSIPRIWFRKELIQRGHNCGSNSALSRAASEWHSSWILVHVNGSWCRSLPHSRVTTSSGCPAPLVPFTRLHPVPRATLGWVTKRRRSFGTRTSGQLENTASAGPPPTLTVRQPVRARGYCENKTMNTNLLKKVQRLEFMGASHSLCSTMLAALEVILPIKLHKSALAEAARFRTRPLCGTGRTGWGTKRWKSTEGRSMISLFNTVCCSFQLTWAVEWTIGRRMSAPSIPGCKFTYMPRTFL